MLFGDKREWKKKNATKLETTIRSLCKKLIQHSKINMISSPEKIIVN